MVVKENRYFRNVFQISLLTLFVLVIINTTTIILDNKNIEVALAQDFKQDDSLNNQLSLSNILNQSSPYQGNTSSDITIIDFSDFQCQLCKRHVDNTEPQINSTYIQTGEAIYVFKHLPNRGIDSKAVSLAAQCTNDQEKFWKYHEILYENQGPIDSGWANAENLKKFASQIPDINMTQFNLCFENKKYEDLVDNDIQLANSLGFRETPSFIIVNNDGSSINKIEGPKPFPFFQNVIEKMDKEE